MGRPRKQRRQSHGSAWHWRQTDCWYYTEPGTKRRVPLFDEKGERIHGRESKEAAELALAKAQLSRESEPGDGSAVEVQRWPVAKVC
jgi:hypothetical protein